VKIVFDIGNVLCYAHTHWQGALQASGLAYQSSAFESMRLYDLPEYLPYESGRVSEFEYLSALCREFGLANVDEARHLHRSILGKEVPGALEWIEELHTIGYQTATLSNNNPIHWEWFTVSGPFPAVQSVQNPISSHLLGAHKPEPAIYQLFCVHTGWSPSELIFFDDVEANVIEARNQGWKAARIDPSNDILGQMKLVIDNINTVC
jgi:glucose-1-phosphatase